MRQIIHAVCVVSIAIIVLLAVYAIPIHSNGQRRVGVLENIDGIPFPLKANAVLITEKLAHADVYLQEPVVGKNLTLAITFMPHKIENLKIGVRENAFWLSYQWYNIYESRNDVAQVITSEHEVVEEKSVTRTVIIPLTDKLQETDRSIDIMLLAQNSHSTADIDEGVHDTTLWELHDIKVKVNTTIPSGQQLKDYVRSILSRERAV